jgi:DNA-directed RNA polymerase subunit F
MSAPLYPWERSEIDESLRQLVNLRMQMRPDAELAAELDGALDHLERLATLDDERKREGESA